MRLEKKQGEKESIDRSTWPDEIQNASEKRGARDKLMRKLRISIKNILNDKEKGRMKRERGKKGNKKNA